MNAPTISNLLPKFTHDVNDQKKALTRKIIYTYLSIKNKIHIVDLITYTLRFTQNLKSKKIKYEKNCYTFKPDFSYFNRTFWHQK